MSTDWSIEVENLSKRFRLYSQRNDRLKGAIIGRRRNAHQDFWALQDVSFAVREGESLAVLGHNGSGKSTLLKCLAQILYPETGTVRTRGRVAALLEIGSGFHPDLSGRDNIFLNAAILGIKKAEIRRKLDEIIEFSGVEQFIDQPVKNYSSGMYVRLAFSVAINVDPDVLLLDEVLAVGDAAFQQRSRQKFDELTGSGRTIVLVSHSLPVLTSMCDTALWLEKGRVRDFGETREIVAAYEESLKPETQIDTAGRKRFGTGGIQVNEVDIVDSAGHLATAPFRVGDPVTLRVRYTAERPVAQPHFSVVFSTLAGVEVWRSTSGGLYSHGAIEPGIGYFDVHIPALPLAGGEFLVSVIVHDHETATVLDFVLGMNRLRTASHSDGQMGIVGMPVTWGPIVEERSRTR